MQKLVLFFAFVAVAVADVSHLYHHQPQQYQPQPQQYQQGGQVPILRQSQDIGPDGSYNWAYETGNGIAAQEQGQHQATGAEEGLLRAQGSFQYTAPDGTPVQVQYVADENGFQPQGAHLPTPPPVPEAIARSLQYQASQPQQPTYQQPAPAYKNYGRK